MRRALDAWHELVPEQRLAGAASVGLFLTMFLPWYQQNGFVSSPRAGVLQSRNLNAFAVFSFVEAAVLLVAAAVLFLLFARAERRSFHLPGSDGTIVLIAGGWAALLLIWRLFDKPGIPSHGVAANVGVQWGIFFALAAAGLLTYAGSRMRSTRRPEPPLRRRAPESEPQTSLTHVLEAPGTTSEEPSPSPRAPEPEPPPRGRFPPTPRISSPSTTGGRASKSGREPVSADSEQLSFEESPPMPERPSSEQD